MTVDETRAERRRANRFPISRDLTYRVLTRKHGGPAGVGLTINISSSGVLFSTADPPSTGTRLELAISWPVQLNGDCPLNLVMTGRVARSEPGCAAVEVDQHEFRTRAKA